MNCKALAVSKSGRTLKTLLTAIVVFASMITGMAQVPSYVPTNGLVGWWPFNGNANDESGNGNNGTINGATLTADRNGNANAAYSFNSASIQIPLTQQIVEMKARTISLWFNPTVGQTGGRLFEATNYSWGSAMYNQNTIDLWYQKSNQAYNAVGYTVSNLNTWNNLIYICDSINQIAIVYLNGNMIYNSPPVSNPGSPNVFINQFLRIGVGNANEYFEGYIDDIAIWNRPLTQQEITNLYTSSTPPPCNPLAANLMNGLVGYWPFCGNANDESGNGNNGTVNGATLTTDRFGNVDAAYSFDRSSIKSIDIVNSNELDSITNISISLWMNISSYGQAGQAGYNHYLDKSDQNNSHQFILANNNVGLYFYYGSGSNFFQTNTLPILNQWNNLNLTYTYDGSLQNSWCRFYLNGICTDSFPTNVNLPITNYDLKIGSLGTANYNVVDGLLDDICIWNRALSQNEITQLYTGSPLSVVSPDYQNTIKVYPNPSSSQITIDFGANYTTMAGYTMRIQNAVGQTVYTTGITQQQFTSNLSTWTSNGIYFVYLIDAQGNTVDVKKIILQ